jgi:hypothetical protein
VGHFLTTLLGTLCSAHAVGGRVAFTAAIAGLMEDPR